MAIAEGSTTDFRYKKEAVPNAEETGAGGSVLRRVTGEIELVKPEVVSQEKRTDFQETNVLHGTRSVNWSINGEMFGGDYKEFLAAGLRRDFTSVSQITADMSISSGVLTRAAGDFIADGLYTGLVVRLGTMTTTANLSRNLRITAMDATTLTLLAVDGGAAVADDAGPNASATVDVPGMITFVPSTGHTSDTFTIEKHDTKTDSSHIAWGNKVGVIEISVQPDTPVGLNFSGLGINRRSASAGNAPSLTAPTAAGTGALMSSGIGYARIGVNTVAVVTGLDMQINNNLQNAPVIFNNVSPDVFYGRAMEVTGTIVTLKEGITLSDIFDNEDEVALEFFIEAPGSDPQSFVSIYCGRCKLNSATEADNDGPDTQSFSFRAIKPLTATGINETTIMLQDSSVS